ncbi:hypothetical protein COY27_05225 [Candidatus Woesearchaeota archaeon CG_4_10_14_0_2_um_filter_33_13]|nr:MAG: hypothetical protein COY27_05225 [Candidatus Woesearchaeota archaeon CG_4_10_14_0_2_um_filter_33_13]
MSWENAFKTGTELVLATSSKKGDPNANIVISLGFVDNKLLVADCQMNITIKNLQSNNKICVIPKNYSEGYYRVKGSVEILNSGKYFDICTKGNKQFPVKNAILIDIKEVFDLDKLKVIQIRKIK